MEVISVAKFTHAERHIVKSLIAALTIKRIPDKEIIKNIVDETNKTISERTLYKLRQSIKRDSYKWYTKSDKIDTLTFMNIAKE